MTDVVVVGDGGGLGPGGRGMALVRVVGVVGCGSGLGRVGVPGQGGECGRQWW